MKLSASSIKVMNACNRQWYYKYIQHLETTAGARAVLGKCVHKAIELGFQGNDPFKVFADTWAEQSAEIEDRKGINRIYDEGLKMLVLYNFDRIPPIEMEVGFELPFPNQDDPLCIMQGYIDQIFDGDIIVDLKTGLRKPLQGVLNSDPQFIIYSWAFQQLYGSLPRIYWHHLRTGEMLEAHVSEPSKLQAIIDVVTSTVNLREQGDDIRLYHQSVGFSCQFCSFRLPCLGVEN